MANPPTEVYRAAVSRKVTPIPQNIPDTAPLPAHSISIFKKNSIYISGFFLTTFALCCCCFGDQHPISIDGKFEEWSIVNVAHDDPLGDSSGALDFGRLWLADDSDFLFIRIEFNADVDASENNSIRLFLDTDSNSSTGVQVGGIGAELEWRFGARFGFFYFEGDTSPLEHAEISFRGAPTVTSDTFEFAIGRDSLPDGSNPLFNGSTIRVLLIDDSGGDQIPNIGQTVTYVMDQGDAPMADVIPLNREMSTDLRLLTHNVRNDNPWQSQWQQEFGRLWSAVSADILCFQEIYNHSLNQTIQLVEFLVPSGPGESWHGASNFDCKTISRFPIVDSWSLDNNLAVLINTTDVIQSEMLIINVHLPCCTNDSQRQNQVDNIMSFIRDAKNPGGVVTVDLDTPIVICGDTNFVGLSRQLTTLITGDIEDNGNYGPDFLPDWDSTDLTNLITRQTEKRMAYTWRNDFDSFWPGHLDFVIYTDSVLELGNNYIVYTPEMSNPQNWGLQPGDSLASDHLMFVADFRAIPDVIHGDVNRDGVVNLLDVGPFIEILSTNGYQPEADINKDGVVDLLDVEPFIAILSG